MRNVVPFGNSHWLKICKQTIILFTILCASHLYNLHIKQIYSLHEEFGTELIHGFKCIALVQAHDSTVLIFLSLSLTLKNCLSSLLISLWYIKTVTLSTANQVTTTKRSNSSLVVFMSFAFWTLRKQLIIFTTLSVIANINYLCIYTFITAISRNVCLHFLTILRIGEKGVYLNSYCEKMLFLPTLQKQVTIFLLTTNS